MRPILNTKMVIDHSADQSYRASWEDYGNGFWMGNVAPVREEFGIRFFGTFTFMHPTFRVTITHVDNPPVGQKKQFIIFNANPATRSKRELFAVLLSTTDAFYEFCTFRELNVCFTILTTRNVWLDRLRSMWRLSETYARIICMYKGLSSFLVDCTPAWSSWW